MCTSLTYQTADNTFFLARTMDFGFELEGRPIAIPRNYIWHTLNGQEHRVSYGFMGTGRDLDGYFFADGVNERGLAIAELYHVSETSYNHQAISGKINLAPYEFISWVLGELNSVAQVRERVGEVNLLDLEIPLLGEVPPLHFILIDRTGEHIVIEIDDGRPVIKENPVGVMTNSPSFEWQLTNLNNYVYLNPTNFAGQRIGDMEIKPFGQASGTFGMPGGYTSPERFIRTAFLKEFAQQAGNKEEALNEILKLLNCVTIPRGVNIKNDGTQDYTQYRVMINITDRTYYYNPYDSNELFALDMSEKLLNSRQPVEYQIEPEMKIQYL